MATSSGRNDEILAMLKERERMETKREVDLTAELQSVRDGLSRTRNAIRALDPSAPVAAARVPATPVKARPAATPMTLTAATLMVLREAQGPMHVRAIYERLQVAGLYLDKTYESFRDTFTGTIGHKARNNQVFTAEGNGVYGLREWVGRAEKEGERANNTDLVVHYVEANGGQPRSVVIDTVSGMINTTGKRPRKIASTIIGSMIRKDRLVEVDGKLYAKGSPQLTLMKDTTAA